ncbi:MAG: hypothetical protein HQL94_10670, partial [Magnetococcales bacterium]|nr:hypothetical protein [Magnetococcales bacterium]
MEYGFALARPISLVVFVPTPKYVDKPMASIHRFDPMWRDRRLPFSTDRASLYNPILEKITMSIQTHNWFRGPGRYFWTSDARLADLELGYCATQEELARAIRNQIQTDRDEYEWGGLAYRTHATARWNKPCEIKIHPSPQASPRHNGHQTYG